VSATNKAKDPDQLFQVNTLKKYNISISNAKLKFNLLTDE
jgi:hypothetical protein